MAESSLTETKNLNPPDRFQRKIVFVPVKKPFKGISNDFHIETQNPTTSEPRQSGSVPGTSPAASNKHDVSEFSEYALDPELSFGTTVRRIGAGLRNLGNTCFLNSVLQCLTYTEPLAAYLQSGKHKTSCRIAGFCALCAMQSHVSCALQSTGRIISPEALVGNIQCISPNFRIARQEDAHEYMMNLLESMHKCCLPSGVPSESPGAYEKSLVHKIFGGRLQSQVKCQQCSYCSNKFDQFLDLSLEIFKADSLQKALANFTAAEWLDGGERQYNCQRCKQKVRALKQLTIHEAPYVLTIHLKRFHAYDPGQKIKKRIHFGCALDLKPFVGGSYDGDVKYSLYGVLVHSGSSTHSGHYYCYVRTSNNMWYTLDDNRVSHVSEWEVLNQQAYMLFYVRDSKSIAPRKPVDIAKSELECLSSLDHSGKDNIIPDNMKCLASPDVDGDNLFNKNGISEDGVKDFYSIEPTFSNPQTSTAKRASDGTSQSQEKKIVVKVDMSAAEDSITNLSKSTDPITPPIQPKLIHQVGTSATGSMFEKACTGMCENVVDSLGLVLNDSLNRSLNKESLNQKQVKKSKKKFLKYPISGMHLRPSLLFMAYLGSRKKKKNRKRSKRHMLGLKNPSIEKLDKHDISSDVGPSTPGAGNVFRCV